MTPVSATPDATAALEALRKVRQAVHVAWIKGHGWEDLKVQLDKAEILVPERTIKDAILRGKMP